MPGTTALPANAKVLAANVAKKQLFWRTLIAILTVWSLYRLHPMQNTLDEVSTNGELHVIGVAGPTTFLPQGDAARGLQYELLREFADTLGVTLVLETAPNAETVIRKVQLGEADIGITGLASDDPRLKPLLLSDPYLAVNQQLIQRSDDAADALDNPRIAVSQDSAEAVDLKGSLPDEKLIQVRNATPEKLLLQVGQGKADLAVLNETDFAARRAAFPDLEVSGQLRRAELAWALRRKDDKLLKAANAFLGEIADDGTLQRLTSFYGQGKTFDTVGVRTFRHDMQARLPQYRKAFEKEAAKLDMDWRLLAAIGYQESKWDPKATSPTGVTGLMMLTRETASDMGVTNRGNPAQSIKAGANYYKLIESRIPDSVREPDRTWMTLAAYNMGPGNILKARDWAAKAGDDPDKWLDVSKHLRRNPRAGQALVYVQEVRRYYDALLMTQPNEGWFASRDAHWRVVY